MFLNRQLASCLGAGIPATIMCAGMFASGVLLSFNEISINGERLRGDTLVFRLGISYCCSNEYVDFLRLDTCLTSLAITFFATMWGVICTANFDAGPEYMLAHVLFTLVFILSVMATSWVAYVIAKAINISKIVLNSIIIPCQFATFIGLIVVGIGFGIGPDRQTIAIGEMIILGVTTVTYGVMIWILWSELQNAKVVAKSTLQEVQPIMGENRRNTQPTPGNSEQARVHRMFALR
jgi:hypothetical protein